uniref:Polyprotein protein n=1 Tax=Solanum tuberosum TaxID=4113 RepID=M1DRZ8_SOLTU
MSMIFGTMEIPDMPTDSHVPPATTEDEVQADEVAATESEADTHKEQLGVYQETTLESLTEIDEAMVQSAVQISLADTSMAGSSGANIAVTLSSDAQDQSAAPGIGAPIDGATV